MCVLIGTVKRFWFCWNISCFSREMGKGKADNLFNFIESVRERNETNL